jgi:hypothetical protein
MVRKRPTRLAAAFVLLASVGCGDEAAPPPGAATTAAGSGGGPPVVACEPGTRPLDDGGCRPAGIPPDACAAGFVAETEGCRAVLPSAPCGAGLMAVPGETVCRDVATCGDGAWGDAPRDPATQYVDASYNGASSDGTAQSPWPTIQQAVDAAAPGAAIAVAAGSYSESVLVTKRVRIWGKCPAAVEIVGPPADEPALVFLAGASGSELHALALRGEMFAPAVSVIGATDIALDRVWIHDAPSFGVGVIPGPGAASVKLSGSLVERAGDVGVFVSGSSIAIEATVVRDVAPGALGEEGYGVAVVKGAAVPSSSVTGSLIERAAAEGIFIDASIADIDATSVRGPEGAQPGATGRGINVQQGTARIRGCVVERARHIGIFGTASVLDLEATTVRDTTTIAAFGGGGIVVQRESASDTASLTVRSSLFERNQRTGILSLGVEATLESVLVRDTRASFVDTDLDDALGVLVEQDDVAGVDGSGALRWSVVDGSRVVGVAVVVGELTLEGTAVRNTVSSSDARFGDGVAAITTGAPTSLTVASSLIERSARAGLTSFGASAGVADSVFQCNPIQVAGEPFGGVSPSFEDLGGNTCGCGDEREECTMLTTGLAVPDPLAP